MGICESKKNKIITISNPSNISMRLSNNSINNEVEVEGSVLREVNKNFYLVIPSICLIKIGNRKGTGFFIKINKDLYYLMTNEHVIKKEMIELKQEIEVKYDYEKKNLKINLDQSKRIIKYDIKKDITIIKILPEDKIQEKYFLLPYKDKISINQKIYIAQYPGGKLCYSEGYITNINDDILTYNSTTKNGSSGSPIFLYDSIEVIGIHKQGNSEKLENYGIIFSSIKNILNRNDRKYINEKGDYYIGQYKKGLKHGKGKIYYKNGNIKYDGDFVKDKFEGYGKYIYENGNYYIGQWVNGLRQGKGKIYYKNGNIKYDGDFVKGTYEGYGKYICENGDYYIGQCMNGLRHGKGKEYYKNGNIKYEGDFVKDKYEGNGKYICENGNYYIGQYKNGLRHGKGKIYYKNDKIKYEGDFVNGKYEGYGKLIYENGNYYIGQWMNGLRHGKGKIYYKNGNIKYDGDFIKDKIEDF